MVRKLGILILFYTPLALVSVPVCIIYGTIKSITQRKKAKTKHWQPESPYERPSVPNRNTHYGVDL